MMAGRLSGSGAVPATIDVQTPVPRAANGHQQFPSAVSIHSHHAHGCAECLPGEDAGGDDTGVRSADAQVFVEDGGLVEGKRIHAAHLLT